MEAATAVSSVCGLPLGASLLGPILFDIYLYLYLELVSIHYGIYISLCHIVHLKQITKTDCS